jgi:hypothetical protein
MLLCKKIRLEVSEQDAATLELRILARLGPHTGDPVRCADVFTAIEYV